MGCLVRKRGNSGKARLGMPASDVSGQATHERGQAAREGVVVVQLGELLWSVLVDVQHWCECCVVVGGSAGKGEGAVWCSYCLCLAVCELA